MIGTRETRIVDASNAVKAAAAAFAQHDHDAGTQAVQAAHNTLVAVWDEGPHVSDVTILFDLRDTINRLQKLLNERSLIPAVDVCDRAHGSLTRIADRWV